MWKQANFSTPYKGLQVESMNWNDRGEEGTILNWTYKLVACVLFLLVNVACGFFYWFFMGLKTKQPKLYIMGLLIFYYYFYLSFPVRTDWAQDPYFSSSVPKKKNLKTAGAQTCRKRTAPARVQGNLLGRVRSSWFDVCDGANLRVILRTAELLRARLGTENPRQGLTAFAAMGHPTEVHSLLVAAF